MGKKNHLCFHCKYCDHLLHAPEAVPPLLLWNGPPQTVNQDKPFLPQVAFLRHFAAAIGKVTNIVKNLTDRAMSKLTLMPGVLNLACSPREDDLSEKSALILTGMTESDRSTVRGMTGIYTSQVGRASVGQY